MPRIRNARQWHRWLWNPTQGHALGTRLGCQHRDLDDCFWMATKPPYQQKRVPPKGIQMLLRGLHAADNVVASGSLLDWGARR